MSIISISLIADNGQYVCAEGGGGGAVVANSNSISPWATFRFIDLSSSMGGNKFALKVYNEQGISLDESNKALIAEFEGLGEIFKLIDLGSNKVALQASNGKYVCAEGGGGRAVVANSDAIGPWETFVSIVEENDGEYNDDSTIPKVAIMIAPTDEQSFNYPYPDDIKFSYFTVCPRDEDEEFDPNYEHLQLAAHETSIGPWEMFQLIDLGNQRVAFKAHNGRYLSFHGSRYIVASGNAIGSQEIFKIIDAGNNKVAFKASNGYYVEAWYFSEVGANGYTMGPWEKFTIVPIAP